MSFYKILCPLLFGAEKNMLDDEQIHIDADYLNWTLTSPGLGILPT